MSDDLQTLRADIGFLRGLAEEGRTAAPASGAILVAAGALYGCAAVGHWLVQTGRVNAPEWAYPLIWVGATALFLVALVAIKRRAPKSATTGYRAASIAWAGVGWTIAAMTGSIALIAERTRSAIPVLLFAPIVLSLYGLAWMVAAAVSRKRWIWATSAASYLLALVNAWLSGTDSGMLIYAASLALLAIAPGVVLMRARRAS